MTILASAGLEYIGVLDTAIVAILGYVIVFFGLILLMGVVVLIGKFFILQEKKNAAVKPGAAAATAAQSDVPKSEAPGSAGNIMIHDVEPKTAAMLMAIVADKMGKPLNELRFISIKEVK